MRKMKQFTGVVLAAAMFLSACSGAGAGSGAPAAQGEAAKEGQAAPGGGSGETIKIKITTTQNPNQQMGKGMALLIENLEKEFGDRVEVDGYDSAQLYTGAEEITACEHGDIQMFFGTGGVMETVSKSVMVVKLPYLFPDADTAYKVLEDPEINELVYGKLKESGLYLAGFFNSGISMIANNKHAITSPEDFKGLKMRAPGTMEAMNLAELGASSITTPAEETYSSVQQGVIDGMVTPTSVFLARNFNEVQDHVTNPGMMALTIGYLSCNQQWLDSLAEEDRAKVLKAVDDTIAQMRINIQKDTDQIFEKCAESGCEVYNMTDEDIALMKTALEPVYEKMASEVGADVIDAVRAKVEEISK